MRRTALVLPFILATWLLPLPAPAEDETGEAAFHRGDISAALEAWRPRAAEGDPRAQLGLGRILLVRNDVRGLDWIRKSANAGYLPAEHHFGLMCLWGRYVPRDRPKALAYLRRAADHPAAESTEHPLDAARAHHLMSQAFAGGIGVTSNMGTALRLLRLAADAGYAGAQLDLAERLEKGDGTARDLVEAHTYYVLAWEQGMERLQAPTLSLRRRLSAADLARSRSTIRAWKEAMAAGTHGQVYRFRDHMTRGQRVLDKLESMERDVLEVAKLAAHLGDTSCESIWLRERKIAQPRPKGGTRWVEHWILDHCGTRSVVRVDFERAGADVRWNVPLTRGAGRQSGP